MPRFGAYSRFRLAISAWRNARRPPHTFQSFWWDKALSPYELLCLKSFIACGFGFDLYTFNPHITVPAGVRVCNASEILPLKDVFVSDAEGFGHGSPAAFTNLFRYKLLADRGGWWCDTDVVCLSKDIPFFAEFFAYQDDDHINNALLYFKPHHSVMIRCFDEAAKAGRNVGAVESGPLLLTRVLHEFGCANYAAPPDVCYPIHFTQFFDVLRSSEKSRIIERTKSALFLHLWNALFDHAGVQKHRLPPKNSFLRRLIEQHRINGWSGEYDDDDVERLIAQYHPPWQGPAT
jgi:hypothetical protein